MLSARYWLKKSNRLKTCFLLFSPFILFLVFRSALYPLVSFVFFFFAVLLALFSIALLTAPMSEHVPSSRATMPIAPPAESLPPIPRTLARVYSSLSDEEFEIFSAALVIAMGEGHTFHEHSGQSGDQGVDARLLNLHQNRVVIQSKHYASSNHVGQPELRDFLGSIVYHKAVYGFFITTSTFTEPALRLARGSHGRIRTIDGRQIDVLLRYRSREIALALRDIHSSMAAKDQ